MNFWYCIICFFSTPGSASFLKKVQPKPNVVVVIADDLGIGEVGLFSSGSPNGRLATPNLDSFGRDGIVFTNAYGGYTVCAPSRTTLFAGRNSGNFEKHGLDGLYMYANQSQTTLAGVLHEAGYTTGAFGKVSPLERPLEQGFDAFVGQVNQGECHNMYPTFLDQGTGRHNLALPLNQKNKDRSSCMEEPEEYSYSLDVVHDEAMKWIEAVAGGPKPFFLYLAYNVPHAGGWSEFPLNLMEGAPVPAHHAEYADMPWPQVEKDHAAVVTYMDAKFGELMAKLAVLGIDDNTLVLFASDNGAHEEGGHLVSFFNSSGGLKGYKRSFDEGGVRSPSMARWPGVVPGGSSSTHPWAFWDVLPTLADVAGAEHLVPEGLDGKSFAPALRGEEQPEPAYLYWTWGKRRKPLAAVVSKTFSGPEDRALVSGYAVRSGRWKGVVTRCDRRDHMRLYDLEADPAERTNVAKSNRHVVEQLKALVDSEELTCQCYQCP